MLMRAIRVLQAVSHDEVVRASLLRRESGHLGATLRRVRAEARDPRRGPGGVQVPARGAGLGLEPCDDATRLGLT